MTATEVNATGNTGARIPGHRPQRTAALWPGLVDAGLALTRQVRVVAEELRVRDELVYCVTEGRLAAGGGPLSVHYLGRKRFADEFLAFFDRDEAGAPPRRTVVRSEGLVEFLLERHDVAACPADADVLFVDAVLADPDREPRPSFVTHLDAVLPLRDSLEAQLELVRSKGHRRKLQAALKGRVRWRESRSAADFDHFYDTLYAPFVKGRFQGGATVVPREEMEATFARRGVLLLIEEDGRPVSGALMYTSRHHPRTLYYWKYGLLDGASLPPAVFGERNGVTEATVLRYAVSERFEELDFGFTRALPRDGIFVHKKRLGCDFRKPPGVPQFRLLLHPRARARFLSRFPLVVQEGGAMHAWLAREGEVEGAQAAALEEQIHACAFPSAASVRLFATGVTASRPILERAVEHARSEVGCVVEVEVGD